MESSGTISYVKVGFHCTYCTDFIPRTTNGCLVSMHMCLGVHNSEELMAENEVDQIEYTLEVAQNHIMLHIHRLGL